MNTLTFNSVKRSAPSPTGRTPEAKRNAEKLEDSTSSNMGDNTDPRPNTGHLKGNKPPQNTGTSTSTSPKSAGASRPGADNRSRRSPSPTRSGRGRDKRQAGKTHEVNTNSASRPSRYDEYIKYGNRMNTLTSNSVNRSAPSPTGRTPEAKRNAEKLEDSTSSNMGDNTDPRPNTGPLKDNKLPPNTGTLTLTSPKSAGASRLGADNRSTPFADAAKRTRTNQIMGDLPKTLTMGEIIEALRNGQIFDQFE